MKRKTAEETVSCMNDIFNEAINTPKTILFDIGSELRNRLMDSLLKKLDIKVYSSDTSIHAPFVERFNYTIQTMIYKFISKNETFSFYKSLDKSVQKYNLKIHSALKISPNNAELDENQIHVKMMHEKKFQRFKRKNTKYKIGQKVRISIQKKKFSRGYDKQFQKEKFVITDINRNLPIPLYVLKSIDLNEDVIKGKFYENEIYPIA